MGHDHHHHGSTRAGERHRGRLRAAFLLIAAVFVVELVVALATGSLALLSDAGHMLTDVVGLLMALAAIHLATRARRVPSRSFGLYRLEILAALGNAVLLLGVAVWVLVEAVGRVGDAPGLATGAVLVAAAVGLAANVVAFFLLRDGAAESINVRGAYLEVVADLVGSVGVLVATGAIVVTGWHWLDPLVGALLGLWILPRTWRLAAEALRILLQAAPPGLDLEELQAELAALPGVLDAHDVHVWTLTSNMDVASAHLMVSPEADSHAVLDQARDLLSERYRVDHATLQVEPSDHTGCSEVTW
jgi:cobalt-zinc-cadmium efflux system protein